MENVIANAGKYNKCLDGWNREDLFELSHQELLYLNLDIYMWVQVGISSHIFVTDEDLMKSSHF